MDSCTLCDLHKNCKTVNIAPDGTGPVVFLGEAPGSEEDYRGKPFIGKSGEFLRKMISLLGLEAADIRFTNAVRCHPPGNKTPSKSQIKACQVHLKAEFEAHPPAIIVPLGNSALEALRMAGLLDVPGKITALNSKALENGDGPSAGRHLGIGAQDRKVGVAPIELRQHMMTRFAQEVCPRYSSAMRRTKIGRAHV